MFGCCNHVVAIRVNAIHHGFKVRQVGHTFVCSTIHHHRRLDKRKPTLLNKVHSVGLKCHFKTSKITLEEIESASCNLCSPFQINPLVLLDQVVVRLWFKIKGWLFPVQGVLRIARFISARGYVWMEEIWNGHPHSIAFRKQSIRFLFHLRNLCAQISNFRENALCFCLIS